MVPPEIRPEQGDRARIGLHHRGSGRAIAAGLPGVQEGPSLAPLLPHAYAPVPRPSRPQPRTPPPPQATPPPPPPVPPPAGAAGTAGVAERSSEPPFSHQSRRLGGVSS